MSAVPLLDVVDLAVRYPVGGGARLTAVGGVSLTVERGSVLGVVGESGCGKSSLAAAIMGLVRPEEGTIRVDGRPFGHRRSRESARRVQMVFQDPSSALNPRMTVRAVLTELVTVHRTVPADRVEDRVRELVAMVDLPESVLDRLPRSLSGGQRQRVGIARALAPEPDLLILDEAVSALDVSVQAAVLALLRRLQRELGLAMVFISHDLGVIRSVCDRVAVMYLGRVAETGEVERVFSQPSHPYTRALLDAVPRIGERRPPGRGALTGEPPSPVSPPPGCHFHPRCARARDECARAVPVLADHRPQSAACFFPLGEEGAVAALPVPATSVSATSGSRVPGS